MTITRNDMRRALPLLAAMLLLATGSSLVSACGSDAHAPDADAGQRDETPAGAHPGEQPGENLVHLTAAELEEFDIEIRTAGPGTMHVEKTFPGEVRVNQDRYAHVVPRVPGVVRTVNKAVGDAVRAGELMAVLESRELADAKADYLAALERQELSRVGFEREERLYEKKISSEQEYLEARQALAEARITLRSSRQKLRALGFSEAYIERLPDETDASLIQYPLTAPIGGTVVEKHIVPGEALDADAGAFEVADLSTVWVDLSIYQKDLAHVREGQEVVVTSGGLRDRGTISYVRPLVGEATRTALARVVLKNDGRWRPGMFASGSIALSSVEVPVLVPKTALQEVDGQKVVFVRTPEGFVPRAVVIGEENADLVAVASGLAAGDAYVARGAFTLKSQLARGAFEDGHAH